MTGIVWYFLLTSTYRISAYHGELYSKQHYVIMFVSDLRQVVVHYFCVCIFISSTIKLTDNNVTEIYLKLALSTNSHDPKTAEV